MVKFLPLVGAVVLKLPEREAVKLRSNPLVWRVEKVFVVPLKRSRPAPTDTPQNWGLVDLGVEALWGAGIRGQGTVVAVIDTGVASGHPALGADKVIAWCDAAGELGYVPKSDKPLERDTETSHGTHVCGIVAGKDSVAKIGVAPDALLAVASAYVPSLGGFPSDALLYAGEWVLEIAQNYNIVACNNSWGIFPACRWETFRERVVKRWIGEGIIPVFAAGNEGPEEGTIVTPADFPESVAVAAYDWNGNIANFSSRGPSRWNGWEYMKPDFAMPGVDITSCVFLNGTYGYAQMSGTSMAAPHFSGILALMASAGFAGKPLEALCLLARTSQDLGEPGKDNLWGFGKVNISEALANIPDLERLIIRFSGPYAEKELWILDVPCADITSDVSSECRILPGSYTLRVEVRLSYPPTGELVVGPIGFEVGNGPCELEVEIPSAEDLLQVRLSPEGGFNPVDKPLRIKVLVLRDATVSVWIESGTRSLVTELETARVPSGCETLFSWDGRGQDGNVVKEGKYVIGVRADFGKISTVKFLQTEVRLAELSIKQFYPFPHPLKAPVSTLRLKITLYNSADFAEIYIFNVSGELIYEARKNTFLPVGTSTLTFENVVLKPGLYVLALKVGSLTEKRIALKAIRVVVVR